MKNIVECPLLPMDVLENAAAVLRVMAHPHRLRIVELLLQRPMTVSHLVEQLGLAPNAVSQHLNFMKARGILASARNGRCVTYSVVHPQANTVIGCIRRNTPRYETRGLPPDRRVSSS